MKFIFAKKWYVSGLMPSCNSIRSLGFARFVGKVVDVASLSAR